MSIPNDLNSWTLNRNFRNSVDSHIDEKSLSTLTKHANGKMRYDLIASDDEILQASGAGIKRTKSFWKFGYGRGDDILAGMSLWQHRDLVAVPSNLDDPPIEADSKMDSDRVGDQNGTLTKASSAQTAQSAQSVHEKRNRQDSVTSLEMYEDDEERNVYSVNRVLKEPLVHNRPHSSSFTPKSRMKIMKTIEIDIENPRDSEPLSTIKRGPKGYQKEYRESTMLQQTHGSRPADAKKGSSSANSGARSASTNHKKSYDGKTNASGSKSQNGSNHRERKTAEAAMRLHSTEDEAEGESDNDNGTLKMSDINNFFDEMPHDGVAGGGIIMKTVKRKDILKQYYTSEDESDDAEIKSTSSDPYDCIVINDHLVRRDEKHKRALQQNSYQEHQMEFQTFRATTSAAGQAKKKSDPRNESRANAKQQQQQHQQQQQQHQQQQQQQQHHQQHQQQQQQQQDSSDHERYHSSSTLTRNTAATMQTPTATILPRTRLMKSTNTAAMTLERATKAAQSKAAREANAHVSANEREKEKHFGKTYGPWYDFWDQQPDQQHSLVVSQKTLSGDQMN